MPVATVGLTMTEYAEYTQLTDLHRFYSDMVFQDTGEIINFKKAIDDTIRRWNFIASWVSRQTNKNVYDMKKRIESPRITEIMMLDEPLCFDDIICNKSESKERCTNCPLWHITGHPCEHPLGLKYKVTSTWRGGKGFFYPHSFVEILRKIKEGKPLTDNDLYLFVGAW
jgi:hypothetical protein